MNLGIIKRTDSYKVSQWKAYPAGMTSMFSYLESRGGPFDETLWFGLQPILKKFFCGAVVKRHEIDEMEVFCLNHFGRDDVFNKEGWEYILNEHGGHLPLEIRAVPEGIAIPTGNILMSVKETDPKCSWLVNYVESLLLKVWYPTSIATRSWNIRKNILRHLEKSGDPSSIDFKVVDFGYRGCSCEEQAEIGGLAHQISFSATDNIVSIFHGMKHYNSGVCGFSIPATEHSVMTALGIEREAEQCKRFLQQYPAGLIACVSDTKDIYKCCEEIWGDKLRDIIEMRDGLLVIRPDSGNFFEVVPKILEILAQKFGCVKNGKGYKVLNKVRIIQGDGMNPKTMDQLYEHIVKLGWSADNLTVGSGGGLLVENVTRDTHKFAIKASRAIVDGFEVRMFKQPITDPGKNSKTGLLKLIKNFAGKYETIDDRHPDFATAKDELFTVYRNGVLLIDHSFAMVKERSRAHEN